MQPNAELTRQVLPKASKILNTKCHVALDQFQNHVVIAARIPSTVKNNLQENKYYEFTYTIKVNGTIKTMEDINSHLVLDDSNAELKVTLNVKETDKKGLSQIQEEICVPK